MRLQVLQAAADIVRRRRLLKCLRAFGELGHGILSVCYDVDISVGLPWQVKNLHATGSRGLHSVAVDVDACVEMLLVIDGLVFRPRLFAATSVYMHLSTSSLAVVQNYYKYETGWFGAVKENVRTGELFMIVRNDEHVWNPFDVAIWNSVVGVDP